MPRGSKAATAAAPAAADATADEQVHAGPSFESLKPTDDIVVEFDPVTVQVGRVTKEVEPAKKQVVTKQFYLDLPVEEGLRFAGSRRCTALGTPDYETNHDGSRELLVIPFEGGSPVESDEDEDEPAED